MKKRTQSQKLALSRETLTSLTSEQAAKVGAGTVGPIEEPSWGPIKCPTFVVSDCHCTLDP